MSIEYDREMNQVEKDRSRSNKQYRKTTELNLIFIEMKIGYE